MARAAAVIAIVAAGGLLPSSARAQTPPRRGEISTLQLAAGLTVQDIATADVDGDGEVDVIVAAGDPKKPLARTLNVFRARATAPRFASEPDTVLELTPDVVAWAAGDVDVAKGEELVLFSARGVFAWRPGEKPEQSYTRLCTVDFLWQLPARFKCFAYPAALVDLNGDGLVDLAVPEPNGYAIALQHRGESATFAPVSHLRVPEDPLPGLGDDDDDRASFSRGDSRISLHFGDEGDVRKAGPLVSVRETAPAPQFLDFDADGKIDVIAQGGSHLYVWIQTKDGTYTAAPQDAFPLPVPVDRERRLDASYSAHALDTALDGRADVAIFAGDKRSSDVRTQLLLFVQGAGRGDAAQTPEAPLFGPKNLPQELLVLGGFVAGATFDDLDGDRRPDLLIRAVRPDLIDQLRSASTETIDADVYIYRNENGLFARRPDVSWRVNIPLKDFDLTLTSIGDVNGDGLGELLVRDRPERLRVLPILRGKDSLTLGETPVFEMSVDKDSEIRTSRRRGKRVADVFVLEENQVHCVRFP